MYQLAELEKIIFSHHELMNILHYLFLLEPTAYIAAGAIRNSIWAHLHQQHYTLQWTEIDIIYHNTDNNIHEAEIERKLQHFFPDIRWDITNQANVHTWYKTENGKEIAALSSIHEALSFWPETATAIAIRLKDAYHLECIAPFGLEDLFNLNLRWNNRLVSKAIFSERIKSKDFLKVMLPKIKQV